MSNSGFLLTDLGLTDASVSSPDGPYFHIARFRCADGFNYTPTRSQTALQGTTVFTGVPQSYSIVDADTIDVILSMDNSVGPFTFGEIGIYSGTDVLLGVCVFDTLQDKVRAVGNQAGNTWKIHARMLLAQAPVICQIEVTNSSTLLEVPSWPMLQAPVNQLNGANAAIVHESNASDDSILVIRESDYEWDLVAYRLVFTGLTSDSGASVTPVSLVHPGLASVFMELPSTNSRYVAKFSDGSVRRVASQTGTTNLTWVPTLGQNPTGKITIWEDATVPAEIQVVGAYEFNALAVNFNRFWSTPTGTYSTDNAGINQTAIPTVTSRASGTQWNHLSDSIRRFMHLTDITTPVAPSDIIDTDFVLHPNNPAVPGMATMLDRYNKYVSAVATMDSHRNTVDLTSLESLPLTAAGVTRSEAFLTNVEYDLLLDHGTASARRGFANGGGAIIITSTSSNTSTFFQEWKTLLDLIGSIVIDRGTCVSSNAYGTGSSLGLLNTTNTGTPNLIYTASRFSSPLATSITYKVYSRREQTSGKFYLQVIEQLDSGSGYSYASSGTMTHAITVRRASSSLILDPVHSLPTPTVSGTFV